MDLYQQLSEGKEMTAATMFDTRARDIAFSQWRWALAASLAILAPATIQAAVTISTAATKNMICASGVCTPTHKSAILNVTDLQNLLATSNTQVTTGSGGLAAQTNDIVVATALTWASSSVLTLDAYRSVTINKSISVTGTGGVSLVTDDGGTGGALSFAATGNVNFPNLTSSLTINGAAYTLVGNVATLASDIAANSTGDFALARSYDAEGDGTYASSPVVTTFSGSFEGLGNTIKNLTIDETDAQSRKPLGFFSTIGTSGEVQHLGLINIYVKGKVHTANGTGGLVGNNQGTLTGDYTTGRVFGAALLIGGLAGHNTSGTISLSHSTAAVRCGGDACGPGGLVGLNEGTIMTSYASGSVTALAGARNPAGGLVAFNLGGSISNCYATGAVQGSDVESIGGFAGSHDNQTIASSYSTGAVTGAAGSVIGGFTGADGDAPDIANSYWDTTTSGVTNLSQGAGDRSNDPGISGLTTSQLQAGLPVGFSSLVWGENPAINGGLPYLLANPPR